jgi:ethanolamine permease
VAGGVVGIAAIFSDELLSFGGQSLTANIVTMAVLGALLMYVLSMAALFKLRASEPGLPRPYRARSTRLGCGADRSSHLPGYRSVVQPAAHGPLRAHPGPGLRYFRLTHEQRAASPLAEPKAGRSSRRWGSSRPR